MNKISISNASHYKWGNNCDTWLLVNSPELSVKEELIPPGEAELLHYHNNAQQFFYVTEGKALFRLNENSFELTSGEGITVPIGSHHSISNPTSDELKFLVISQPSTANDRINV